MSSYVYEYVKDRHINKVVRVQDLRDPLIVSLLKSDKVVESTLRLLRADDPHFEILTGRETPAEKTRKEIVEKYGRDLVLKELREEDPHLYLRLRRMGQPTERLESWGITVQHTSNRVSRATIRNRLWSLANQREDKRIVNLQQRSPNMYDLLRRRAEEEGMSLKEYVESLGFNYGKSD